MKWLELSSIGLAFLFSIPSHCLSQVGGYVTPLSVVEGDSIRFHLSIEHSKYNFLVYRLGVSAELVYVQQINNGTPRAVPDSSYAKGCNWPVTLSLRIPPEWGSGVYMGIVSGWSKENGVLFFVREKSPGKRARIVVCLSINTWQAYNSFGGKCLYDQFSEGGKRSYKLSFERPVGTYEYSRWDSKLLLWLEREGYPFEVLTDVDIHRDPEIIKNYDLLILAGHDEYWSRRKKQAIEAFLSSGKKLMVLSGNNCWWQVRYEDGEKTMVCYKDQDLDPLTGTADSLVTVNWYGAPVNEPEEYFLGASWRYAGFVNAGAAYTDFKGYGDYIVYNADHWVYSGTDLQEGEKFGYRGSLVGYETDGLPLTWEHGIPMAHTLNDFHGRVTILGVSPASSTMSSSDFSGYATMLLYQPRTGGVVFNGSTTNWAVGLESDQQVQTITRTVLKRFLADRIPPEIISWAPSRVVSKRIRDATFDLNSRVLHTGKNDTALTFSVAGSDPQNKTLSYRWFVDGDLSSTSSSAVIHLSYDTSRKVDRLIKCIVFNDQDSASVLWKIIQGGLRIVSRPVTRVLRTAEYFYSLEVLHEQDTQVTYRLLEGPPWLSIEPDGTVRGKPPLLTQSYQVRIQVSDNAGGLDNQAFLIQITDGRSESEYLRPATTYMWPAYPNPFNPSTSIDYCIHQQSSVSLKILDFLGRTLTTLVGPKQDTPAGEYCVRWTGSDAQGRRVPSGVYIIFLEAIPENNGPREVVTKKVILVK